MSYTSRNLDRIISFTFRYITVLGVIGLLAQYLAVPFFAEKLKLHDSTISLMDAGTSCINQFIIAFATAEYMVTFKPTTVCFIDLGKLN